MTRIAHIALYCTWNALRSVPYVDGIANDPWMSCTKLPWQHHPWLQKHAMHWNWRIVALRLKPLRPTKQTYHLSYVSWLISNSLGANGCAYRMGRSAPLMAQKSAQPSTSIMSIIAVLCPFQRMSWETLHHCASFRLILRQSARKPAFVMQQSILVFRYVQYLKKKEVVYCIALPFSTLMIPMHQQNIRKTLTITMYSMMNVTCCLPLGNTFENVTMMHSLDGTLRDSIGLTS